MKIEQKKWSLNEGWENVVENELGKKAQLVLVFGSSELIKSKARYDEIASFYPNSDVVLCSTSGEILNGEIFEQTLILSALYFEHTQIQTVKVNLKDVQDSFDAGAHVSALIEKDYLTSLLIFSDQTNVNGAHLLTGLQFNISEHIPITGGIAHMYDSESNSYVGLNGPGEEGNIIGIAFSGDRLKIGHGSHGGWMPFGPERFITKSQDNILYELNNKPIGEVFDGYFEGIVNNLEENLLVYPFGIGTDGNNERIVRAFLGFDKEKEGAIYAGDMPEGSKVRMLRTNVNHLLDASAQSTTDSLQLFNIEKPDFALVVNCHARKIVLEDWILEEIEIIQETLGDQVPFSGFYSKGEFSPQKPKGRSELHNHTMIITTFKES